MDVYKTVGSSKRQINQYQPQIRHLETSCLLLQLNQSLGIQLQTFVYCVFPTG